MDNKYNDMSLFEFIVLCVKKLGMCFKWLLNIIRHLIAICWKRWYIIAIGMILGVLFAWVWSKPRFTRFTAEATIVYPEGMKRTVEEGLSCFINLGYDVRHDKLGMPYEVQKRLRGFKFINNIDAKNDGTPDYVDSDGEIEYTDSANTIMQNRLSILVTQYGSDGFEYYKYAIEQHFRGNPEYSEPARRWRESKLRVLNDLNREIARTDSFINHEYFENGASSNNTYIAMDSASINVSRLYSEEMQRLVKERELCMEELAMTPDVVNFVTPFHASCMAIRDKYIYSVLGGFVLALLVSLIIEYRKQINRYLHPGKE